MLPLSVISQFHRFAKDVLAQDVHKLRNTSVVCAFYCYVFLMCSTFSLNHSTKLSISKICYVNFANITKHNRCRLKSILRSVHL